jgi:DNA-binding CsgD family transcriptional regulator
MFDSFGLTRREAEILFWIMQGKTDPVIADICRISLRTVHKHVENIYIKMGVETRTAAMLKALEIK